MKFPFISFFTALVIWGVLLALFSYVIFAQNEISPTSLELDASIVDKVSRQVKSSPQKNVSDSGVVQEVVQQQSDAKTSKTATITARPLPEIPQDLRDEAFNSYAIARFNVADDGSFTVELIKPCSNPRLNQLLLKSLKKWKFSAVKSVQEIRVNFKVE